MDKKSKIFFLVFFLLIVLSIAVAYYKIIVQRDYIIEAQVDCDPYTEACFVYACDPGAGEECTGDPVQDTSYYKFIDRNAKNIPSCDSSAEGCDALTCPEGEAECTFTLCDPATAKDGEVCNDPAVYTLENPVVEDGATATTDAVEGNQSEEAFPQDETGVENAEVSKIGQ